MTIPVLDCRMQAKVVRLPRPHPQMKTTYPKTGTRRRRTTFADGSHVIESSSGYEIFEGIPKPKKAKRKARPAKSAPATHKRRGKH
jgi:hypothetical protein